MNNKRSGMTLLELLVVLSIIAVLIGLLLSGVQKVRQAAAQLQTANRFHQLGLGFHSYLSANNDKLPGYYRQGPSLGNEPRYSWSCPIYKILPFVDDKSSITLYGHRFNRAVINPDDPSFANSYIMLSKPDDPKYFPEEHTNCVVNFLVFDSKKTLMQSVVDGTSNTICMTEKYAFCGERPNFWTFSFGGVFSGVNGIDPFPYPNTDTVHPIVQHRPTFADSWYSDITPDSPLRFSLPPFQIAPKPGQCDPRIPQTPHSALSVLMADGSVKTLRQGMSTETFWALVSPNGGETVNLE